VRRRRRFRKPKVDIVTIELVADFEETPGSNMIAELMFAELDVQPGRMLSQRFEDGRLRYFAVCKSPGPVKDCTALLMEGAAAVVIHGQTCNMTKALDRDIRTGVQQHPFESCEKRQHGGVFEVIEGRRVL
jgi:hypothetical protein